MRSLKPADEHVGRQREPGIIMMIMVLMMTLMILMMVMIMMIMMIMVIMMILMILMILMMVMTMEHLVSANLSLLRETLVASGACCCWVDMHEI